jgi:glycosyltransferase involved in cell wall biosynthesis
MIYSPRRSFRYLFVQTGKPKQFGSNSIVLRAVLKRRLKPTSAFIAHADIAIMSVKVSVILPTFNRSRSLGPAILSVLTQSVKDLELIVVDDASSEDIEALVRNIGDRRIKFIRRKTNGGAAAARNTGLAEATGEYIAFQDSDDLWLPDKLAKQLACFTTLPASVGVVTGAKILYGRDSKFNYGRGKVSHAPDPKRRVSLEEDQLAHILEDNRLSVQSSLFKRDRCPAGEWFDPYASANEDWDFAVRLVQHTLIYEDTEPVLLGFVSEDSISTNRRKQIIGVIRILKKNSVVLAGYKKQESSLLREIGRILYKTGKPKWGMKFLIASVFNYPPSSIEIVRSLLRKLRKMVQKKRRVRRSAA